jgi:hypothetical protein
MLFVRNRLSQPFKPFGDNSGYNGMMDSEFDPYRAMVKEQSGNANE